MSPNVVRFQDALSTFIGALDTVSGHWRNPSVYPNDEAISAHDEAENARATITTLSTEITSECIAPHGMDSVQFVASIRDEVENAWHLCRFVYSIEPHRPQADPDFERLRKEMLNRLPAIRNQLWETWRHIAIVIELRNATLSSTTTTSRSGSTVHLGNGMHVRGEPEESEAEKDDALPKSKRAESLSRVKAQSAYEYAMDHIPDASEMTGPELHAAIKKDDEVAAMVPDNPESFVRYLNDCGTKLKKGGPKAAGGSVVRRSDL